MQYFTKQELQGGVRYGSKCMVGNWNENVTLDEVRVASRPRETPRSFHLRPSAPTSDHRPRASPRPTPPQVRLQDYIAKKEAGTLKMDKFNKRMSVALAPVRPLPRPAFFHPRARLAHGSLLARVVRVISSPPHRSARPPSLPRWNSR